LPFAYSADTPHRRRQTVAELLEAGEDYELADRAQLDRLSKLRRYARRE
jgi:hypothetical protein